jgi:hypothetical protein
MKKQKLQLDRHELMTYKQCQKLKFLLKLEIINFVETAHAAASLQQIFVLQYYDSQYNFSIIRYYELHC